jgi:hypothetical protein
MYQLDIITKIPEPEPDGAIYIRQGESAFLEFDKDHNVSSIQINGRTDEQMEKTIPALVIAISDDPQEIFSGFNAPSYPHMKIPFLAISSDRDAFLNCNADGKIHYHMPAEGTPHDSHNERKYLHELIKKTEYCCIFCSQTDPLHFFHLAGYLAYFGRQYKTLMVLALIGNGDHDLCQDVIDDYFKNFHTIILPLDNTNSIVPIKRIRDLCDATINDVVSQGSLRTALIDQDREKVQGLLLKGGICYLGGHIAGGPDDRDLIKGFVQSVGVNCKTPVCGSYVFLSFPSRFTAASTINEVYDFGRYVFEILHKNIPSHFSPEIRPEVSYPDVEEPYDMNIWIFTGDYKLPK